MATHRPIPINAAVHWNGTTFGWVPALSAEAEAIVNEGESAVPDLIGALADADRFVTAHVILTRISGVRHETHPTWNGLQLDLRADNTLVIDPTQRQALAQRWQKYFRSTPRPQALP
jgi:hypothetical protein